MPDTPNIEVKLPDGQQQHEIVLRTGAAERPSLPKQKLRLEQGALSNPLAFAKHKLNHGLIDKAHTHVELNRADLSCTLVVNHQGDDEALVRVRGEAKPNIDLAELQIYTGRSSPRKLPVGEMAERLKLARMFFKDQEEWARIVAALRDIKAERSVSINVQQASQKGDKAASMSQTTNLPTFNFVLRMPLFEHAAPREFLVELWGDATDSGIHYWLESLELRELQEGVPEEALQQLEADFQALEILVLHT